MPGMQQWRMVPQLLACCPQEGVYDEFEQAVADNVRKLKLGGGLDPQTTLGPLIAPAALDRVRSPGSAGGPTSTATCGWLLASHACQ